MFLLNICMYVLIILGQYSPYFVSEFFEWMVTLNCELHRELVIANTGIVCELVNPIDSLFD